MNQNRHWRAAVIAALLLIVAHTPTSPWTGGNSVSVGIAAAHAVLPVTPPDAPTKLAVLVGINEYGNPQQISPLAGSINDVEDMYQLLTTKFGFLPENIKVLKGPAATHANIIAAIQNNLIARAKPGDIVVFHFSGHGSQMKVVTGKKISGLDETIVPYDSRDLKGKVFDISGAEIHGLLLQLEKKTQYVTFILDSCHSGTFVTGMRTIGGPRVRAIEADTRTPPPPPLYAAATTRGLTTNDSEAPLKYAFIAAATSRESAYEHVTEGKEHGALTYFLTQQLRASRAGVTYRDIMDSVIANVNANYPAQHPQLEGTEADQYVFGDSGSVARSYVAVSPLDGKRTKLSVGQVEGATVGSIYEVYPPGSRKFTLPEKPVARVQLTKVDAFESEGNISSGGKVAPSSRAVERNHRFGSLRMRVYFEDLQASPALQSIKNALPPFKQIEVVNDPAACHLHLRQVQGNIHTLSADLTTLNPPIAADEPALVSKSVERIKQWAKFFNVLSIRNAQSGIDLQFTLNANQTRDVMARVGRPDMGIWAGEEVEATLKNNSERDIYVAILDLSSDGSIDIVYPKEQGAHEVLTPGSTLTRKLGSACVPKGRSRVTDILKVFASFKPIDLGPLTQGQIRGDPMESGEPDPLQDLLMDSNGLTRQVREDPTALGTWTTVQRLLAVKRKNDQSNCK